MKRIIKNYKGFTLIELLVVIAIIAILSVIGLTLFNGVQQNARDARRKSDVDAIAAALESTRQPGTAYYSTLTGTSFSSGVIPLDTYTTILDQYCIKTYNTVGGAQSDSTQPLNDGTTNSWNTTAAVGTNAYQCPSGYLVTTDSAGGGFSATNFPANTKQSWRICAKLENTNSAAGSGFGKGTYCKYSAQ